MTATITTPINSANNNSNNGSSKNTMNSQVELDDLLSRTALSDQPSFERLYEISSPKMYGLALQMVKRKDWADEVLQETFVKIWYNANQYHQQRGSAMNWMTGILRYRAIDLLRAQNRFHNNDEDDYIIDTIAQQIPDDSASENNLDNCMQQLEEKQHKSIKLAFYEGYTHQELSKKLQVPLGTMKSWIRRSLEKLRRCLDELH